MLQETDDGAVCKSPYRFGEDGIISSASALAMWMMEAAVNAHDSSAPEATVRDMMQVISGMIVQGLKQLDIKKQQSVVMKL